LNLFLLFNTDYNLGALPNSPDDLHVFLHWLPYMSFQKSGNNSVLLDDLIDYNDKGWIDTFALQFVRNWFRPYGKDFTIFKGISAGILSEYLLLGKVIEIFRQYFAYEKLTTIHSIESVYTDLENGSIYYEITDNYFENKLKLKPELISPQVKNPFYSPSASYNCYDTHKGGSFLRWLKDEYRAIIYRETKHLTVNGDSLPRIIFSCYRNESLVLDYLNENRRDIIQSVLDRSSMPINDVSKKLLTNGALIMENSKRNPQKLHNEFAYIINEYIRSELYTYYLNSLGVNESLMSDLRSLLIEFTKGNFPNLAVQIEHYDNQFSMINPSAVVVYNDTVPHQRLLVFLAKTRGIPSLLIQHGYHAEPNDGDKRYAEFLAVWGEATREMYSKNGRRSETIAVTGNPYHEPLIKSNSITNNRDNKILVITYPENRLSAFGDKGLPEKYLEEIFKTIECVQSGVEWIIKIHPSESEAYYRQVLSKLNVPAIKLVKDVDLISLIKRCRCIVIPDSTVHTEAYLCGCPIVSLNITNRDFEPPIGIDGGIPVVKNFKELSETVNIIINCPTTKEYTVLKQYIDTNGKSTVRITDFLLTLLPENEKTNNIAYRQKDLAYAKTAGKVVKIC